MLVVGQMALVRAVCFDASARHALYRGCVGAEGCLDGELRG